MKKEDLTAAFLDYCISNDILQAHKVSQVRLVAKESEVEIYEVLLDLHLLSTNQLNSILSEITGFPVADPLHESYRTPMSKKTLDAISNKIAFEQMIFPLKIDEGHLHLVMANPTDDLTVNKVESSSGYPVKRYVCYFKNILRAIVRYYTYLGGKKFESIVKDSLDEIEGRKKIRQPSSIWTEPLTKALTRDISIFSKNVEPPREGEVGVSLLVQKIVDNAIFLGVSDIHIEPFQDVIKVRFRKDGVLFGQWYIPKKLQVNLLNRIKVLAGMNSTIVNRPQGGYISYENITAVGVDIRASSIPTLYGERFSLRILDKTCTLLNEKDLGMEEDDLQNFIRKINSPQGLILLTGPTGSGKTTTIYAALDRLNKESRSIITIEDPIEYQMMGISQIQISVSKDLSFDSAFREVLRQDPDVILLGEIRDPESTQVAVMASSTGHLVFSTLHTTNSSNAIPRLISMGADHYVLSDSVQLIVAQRLVRRLCLNCRRPDDLTDERLSLLGISREILDENVYYVAQRCEKCNKRGYIGRIGVFELLIPDEKFREMIIAKESGLYLQRYAIQHGMRTVRTDALIKAKNGITSLDEVVRITSN